MNPGPASVVTVTFWPGPNSASVSGLGVTAASMVGAWTMRVTTVEPALGLITAAGDDTVGSVTTIG